MHETNKDDFIIEEGNLIGFEDVMFKFENYHKQKGETVAVFRQTFFQT